jgi:hypothetical protein
MVRRGIALFGWLGGCGLGDVDKLFVVFSMGSPDGFHKFCVGADRRVRRHRNALLLWMSSA